MTAALLPHQRLRAATQDSHDRVDAVFARYDLADRDSYAQFLEAHARVLPPIETALSTVVDLPPFPPRTPSLLSDLAALGRSVPSMIDVGVPATLAAAWASFYVVEGSRLGGVMLARQVGAGLPRTYLEAAHGRGGWRAVLASYDAAASGSDWDSQAISAARRIFALYAENASG